MRNNYNFNHNIALPRYGQLGSTSQNGSYRIKPQFGNQFDNQLRSTETEKKKSALMYNDTKPQTYASTKPVITIPDGTKSAVDTFRENLKQNYPQLNHQNLHTSIDKVSEKDVANNYELARQTVENNVSSGRLTQSFVDEHPNLVSDLAFSYAAADNNQYDLANKARKLAYDDVPTTSQESEKKAQENKQKTENTSEQNGPKAKEKDDDRYGFVDGARDFLTAATLIPGVDTFANLASIPFDLYEGEYLSALLSLAGAVPIVGEAADTYKAARLGVKIADKANDAYRATKTLDKIYDVVSKPEVQEVLKNAGIFAECIVDGVSSGRTYENQGKSFNAGFAEGFTSSFMGEIIKRKTNNKALKVIGEAFGSALGIIIEGFSHDASSYEDILKSAAKEAAVTIFTSGGTEYVKHACELANEAKSVASVLMKYDENFGKVISDFFETIFSALGAFYE